MKEIENLYGLTEEEFVKIAKPLDPDTRKVIESPITEEEQQEQTTEQTTEEQA
jgi:DNA-binding cell septation regulator SpoVG